MNIYAPEAGNHLAIHIFYHLTCLAAIVAGLTVAHDTEVIIEWRERHTTDKALAGGPYLVSHFGHCLVPLGFLSATIRYCPEGDHSGRPYLLRHPSGLKEILPKLTSAWSPACPIVRAYRISELSAQLPLDFQTRKRHPSPRYTRKYFSATASQVNSDRA